MSVGIGSAKFSRDARALSTKIRQSFIRQGFRIVDDALLPPRRLTKARLRRLHRPAVEHQLMRAAPNLAPEESSLLDAFARGDEIVPERITPRLVEVASGSRDELLFRYARLHWAIPVSSGYGRRLRFLVIDEANDKLIGLIGLGDPVMNLAARDTWIGWHGSEKDLRMQHVLDAYVLGAVPPYSMLLAGKLVAMLAASDEVRTAFARKYRVHESLIRRRAVDSRVALITTTSALGRSSVYNRIRFDGQPLFESVGYTRGFGDFHLSDGLYDEIFAFATTYVTPTYRKEGWGAPGFRNKHEVIKKTLSVLELPSAWRQHGVGREVFMVPLAENTREFLRGEHQRLRWKGLPAAGLFQEFRARWLLPRSQRNGDYRTWSPDSYRLWS